MMATCFHFNIWLLYIAYWANAKNTEGIRREEKAGRRLSGSRQRNKEEQEEGEIQVTPVSVTEELRK